MRHCNDVSARESLNKCGNKTLPSSGICGLMMSSGLGKRDTEAQLWMGLPLFFLIPFFFFNLILNLSFHLDDSSDNINCLQNVLFCDHVFFNITNHKNKALPVNSTWLKKILNHFDKLT